MSPLCAAARARARSEPAVPISAAASRCRSASRCSPSGYGGEQTHRRLSAAADRGEPGPLPRPLPEKLGGTRAATPATPRGRAGSESAVPIQDRFQVCLFRQSNQSLPRHDSDSESVSPSLPGPHSLGLSPGRSSESPPASQRAHRDRARGTACTIDSAAQ